MRKVPKLLESWESGNTIVEIYEELGTLNDKHPCDTLFYTLRIISKDSRKFPVFTAAVRQAKGILSRKNHRELREIGTEFDLSGKNEKDQ
tara:strand:+ start:1153 stop:1422 length:270 start_codon:yes stop_codon:yes gene_type:complete